MLPVPVVEAVMLKKAGVAAEDEAVKLEMVKRALGVEVPMPTFPP